MALARLLLLVALGGIVGWVCVRTVSVDTSGNEVNISIDTQKLRQASQDAVQQGRQAIAKAGGYLERTGKKMEQVQPEETPPPERPRFTFPWTRSTSPPSG